MKKGRQDRIAETLTYKYNQLKHQGKLGHFEIEKVYKVYLSLSLIPILLTKKDCELNI